MPRTKPTILSEHERMNREAESMVLANAGAFGAKWAYDMYTKALNLAIEEYQRDASDDNFELLLWRVYWYKHAQRIYNEHSAKPN
jgi:hypothetical protein